MLMLGLVAGTASFAETTTSTNLNKETRLVMTNNQKLKLYVQPLQAKGDVAILNASGQAVYKTSVSLQKGLSQQFDFSGLSAGTYQVSLTTNGQTVTKTFVVQANPNESFVMQE